MIPLTYAGRSVFLCIEGPDWSAPVDMDVTVPTRKGRSLVGREARRSLGETLRCRMAWTALLSEIDDVAKFRQSLQDLNDEPVLVPCWPLAVRGDEWAAAPWGGGTVVAWNDGWGSYSLGTTIASPASWDWVAPVLWCRITVESTARTSELIAPRITATEDSDGSLALTIDSQTWTAGPALPDSTVPDVFPFMVDWAERVQAGAADIDAERRTIGPGRTQAPAVYPQTGERLVEAVVTTTTHEATGRLLRWWLDQAAGAHYVPSLVVTAALESTATSGDTTLTITEATSYLGEDRYLALSDPDGFEVARVSDVLVGWPSGPTTAILTAALSRTWVAGSTIVTSAMLARHARDVLSLVWLSPGRALARVSWREVPQEYAMAPGETRGTTIGALPAAAWLYAVTVDWQGATEVHRWTSWETTLAAGGESWVASPIEHSEIRQNLRLDRDELTLRARWSATGPWRLFLPGALDAVVTLAIYECAVSGSTGSSVTQRWSGEVTKVEFDGPFVNATANGVNGIFDRRVPRILLQPGCNHALFDAGCGLDRDAWEFTAVVQAVAGSTVTLETFARTGGLPSGWGSLGYFALGYLERTVAGKPQRLVVWASTAKDGSNRVTVTFGKPASPTPTVGEAVSLWPGCDGLQTTCIAPFNNFARFGGFPYVPDRAPQFTPEKKSDSSTGKK